jgi:hypothetical protein
MFNINMGKVDRSIRLLIAAAIAILIYGEVFTGVWKVIFGIVAIVFTLTAAVGTCPLYLLFGIRTCARNDPYA